MKKKIRILTAVSTLLAVCIGILAAALPVSAENGTESKGNFVLGDGEMAVYAADTDYLQSDMNDLYSELPLLPETSSYSTERKNNIKSKGIIDYANGTVVIDSSDFTYLAEEIDILESAYKINTVNALNQIGTYFMEDGSVTYNPDNADDFTEESAAKISFDKLYNGILTSQSVAHLASRQAVNGSGELLFYASETAQNENSLVMPTTTENGFPLMIQASGADNISSGAAAWVNGKLLIGNGADNTAFYNQGYVDGFNKIMNGVEISYVYHSHSGSCYSNSGQHKHTSDCYEICRCTSGNTGSSITPCASCGHTGGHSSPCNALILSSCDNRINYYPLICSKSTSTIESATLIFH